MTTVEEDDEDSNCLYIAEDGIQPEEPDDDQTSKNAEEKMVPIANNKQTNRNNAEIPPYNIVGLMKNFDLENFRINHPSIFNNDANEQTHHNIDSVIEKEERIKSNGARVTCKPFAQIPFDIGSNLISPELYAHLTGNANTNRSLDDSVSAVPKSNEGCQATANDIGSNLISPKFLESFELHAHLTGNANTNRSLDDSVSAIPKSNEGFQATARRLHPSDTLIQAPNSYTYGPVPPNAVYGKQVSQSGSLNMNTSELRSSIPRNMNVYAVRDENMTTSIPAAQNGSVILPPYPGGPSSTAYRAEVLPNAKRQNPSITNNTPAAMNMHGYGVTPKPPHQKQGMHASEANQRDMYAQDLIASLACYDLNINACSYACCSGSCELMKMGDIPRPALPSFQIPRIPACAYPASCNIQRPLYSYPCAQPNVSMQPHFQTADPRNRYAQARNVNGAMPRGGLYIAEDPMTYATYEQAYPSAIKRKSIAAELPIKEKQKTRAAKAKRTKITTNLGNEATINVNPSFPTIPASHQETTTNCNIGGNTIPNWEAFGINKTATNKRRAKTNMKTLKPKTTTASNAHCSKAALSMKNHLQPNNVNIETTQVYNNINNISNEARIPWNADAYLKQQIIEMGISIESDEITVANYMTNASIQQTRMNMLNNEAQQCKATMNTNKLQVPVNLEQFKEPCTVNSERALIPNTTKTYTQQARLNINTEQSQVNMKTHTIMMEQIIMDTIDKEMQNTKAYIRQPSMKRNVESTAVLFDGIGSSGVEVIPDNIKRADTFNTKTELKMDADITSMNINKIRAHNTQQTSMNTNSGNAQIALIADACLQQAEIAMNTDKTEIGRTMQTSVQQPKINTNSERVQTLINTHACAQQASLNANAQISKAVVQTNYASELKVPTSSTAAESITFNIESMELKTRFNNTFNAVTGMIKGDTQFDKTNNKTQTPISIEQPSINDNEKSNIPLSINAHLHQAGMGISTQQALIDTIDLTMQTNVQQSKMYKAAEKIQTLMNTEEACIQPVCLNKNVENASVSLNLNNLEAQIKVPQNFNAVTHASNTCKTELFKSSNTTESTTLYIDTIDLEPRCNTLYTEAESRIEVSAQQDNPKTNQNNEYAQIPLIMEDYPQQDNTRMNVNKVQGDVRKQTSLQKTRSDTNSERVQTSKSMENCTQQAGSNTYIENLLTLTNKNSYRTQSTVIQTAKPVQASSNVCELNVPTSFTTDESIKHNLESSDFVPNAGNLKPETTLTTETHTSDTIEDITQTQAMVQDQGTKDLVKHISVDFLRSVLYNAHQKSTLLIDQGNDKSARCDVDTKENNTNTIPDIQLTENKIKNKNENDVSNDYEIVSQGNVSNCKSTEIIDIEKEKLKMARQRLALWSKQNENVDVESNPVKDNTQRTIVPNYDSIISLVLNRANILQNIPTRHDIFRVKRMELNDNNNYITNKKKNNVKNNQSDSSINKKTVSTRKRKIHNDREINETDNSKKVSKTSEKRKIHTADDKENASDSGYSRQPPVCHRYITEKEQNTNVAAKLRQVSVAINKDIINDEIENETNKTSDEDQFLFFQFIHEHLFFKFQIQFFGRLHEYLLDNDLQESARNLSYDIYNLIYKSDNPDAKADLEFNCPNCHYVSIYSPRLFYYKGEDHNLQKSDKIVNCENCIEIKKQYIISLRKYILRNKSQLETLKENKQTETKTTTTLSKNNSKTDDRAIHFNKNCQAQSTRSNSSFHIGKKDAENAISINSEPCKKNENNDNDKSNDKNHEVRTNAGADTATTSKLEGNPKNNKANNDDIPKNRNLREIISAESFLNTRKCLASNSVSMGIEKKVSVGCNEVESHRTNDTKKENDYGSKTEDSYSRSEDHIETDDNSKLGGGINKEKDDYDPLEEELDKITNGVSTNSKKAIRDTNLLVKLPWNKFNPSTETKIKNRIVTFNKKKFTLNNASNNIDENDKNHKRNPDVQKTISAITATTTYMEPCDSNKKDHELRDMISVVAVNSTNNNLKPFNTNISTVTNKKDDENKNNQNNREVKKTCSAETVTNENTDPRNRNINISTIDNACNNKNKEKRLKVSTLIGVETPTNINVELLNRNGNTTKNNNSDNANNNKNNINDKIASTTNVKTHIRNISASVNKSRNNDKNYKVSSSTCVETATTTSEDPNNGYKDIGVENNNKREVKRCIGTESESDSKNEKSREVTKSKETATNVNAELRKKNTITNTNDYDKHNKNTEIATTRNGDPQNRIVNNAINTNSTDNIKSIEKNGTGRKDAENAISINAESRKENINDKDDNRNHKVRKSVHDDTATSPNVQREPKNNKANKSDIQKNRDLRKSISAETLLRTQNPLASYSVSRKENNKIISIKIRKVNMGYDEVEARGANDKEEENDKQGSETEDDNDSSSKDGNENDDNSSNNEDDEESVDNISNNVDDKETDDNGRSNEDDKESDDNSSSDEDDNESDNNSSSDEDDKESDDHSSSDEDDKESDDSSSDEDDKESGDEVNHSTRKAIDDAFKSLKEKCNSNEKTELPQVHIPGKSESKKSTEPKDKAFKRKSKLCDTYSYACFECRMPIKRFHTFCNHMRTQHGIHNVEAPEEYLFICCTYCGQDIRKKNYASHIQRHTSHKRKRQV